MLFENKQERYENNKLKQYDDTALYIVDGQ